MAEKSGGVWFKWLVILAIVIATVVGGYFYFHQRQADKLAFNTVVSTRGEVTQNVTATGILNPVKSVQVGCQVSGRINKLYVDFNSPVTNGQIIAEIDQRVYLAQVAQAEADLSNSMANLELQRVQATRNAELFTNQLVSGSDFDISVATLHQAEAAVKIKQALLDNARANLAYTKIISPVDGVIISRSVDVGQTVAASFNTPTLFLIANDLTKMQIDAAVAEADVGGILEDQTVEFTVDAYPYRTFNGAVTQVRNSPTTLNNVVTYDAVVGVTNADYKLKPGMTANVSIIVAQRNDVVKVPNAALRFRPPEAAVILTNQLVSLPPATNAVVAGKGKGRGNRNVRTVYKLAGENSGELIPVQVKTGITDGIFTEIVAGLNEGDKVVSGVVSTDAPAAASNPFGGGNMPRR
jgi:HlyD family secretion protein